MDGLELVGLCATLKARSGRSADYGSDLPRKLVLEGTGEILERLR